MRQSPVSTAEDCNNQGPSEDVWVTINLLLLLLLSRTRRFGRLERPSRLIYASALLGGANAYTFYSLFFDFVAFFPSATTKCINMRQPFSGTAERTFMKLLPNDRGDNVVFNVVLKWELGSE